jgi:transcriptional regulator with GAF, ATPase, and Fis domain
MLRPRPERVVLKLLSRQFALRERQSDILPLAEYFLVRYAQRNQVVSAEFATDAVVALQNYSFPGNVRELEHLPSMLGTGRHCRADPRGVEEREECRAGRIRRPGSARDAVS